MATDDDLARSGSVHVEFLLENKLIELVPSSILDRVYAVQGIGVSIKELDTEIENIKTPSPSTSALEEAGDLPATMLLSPSDGKLIANCLDVPEMEQEIERAIHQVEKALKAKKRLTEEKQTLGASNKGPDSK